MTKPLRTGFLSAFLALGFAMHSAHALETKTEAEKGIVIEGTAVEAGVGAGIGKEGAIGIETETGTGTVQV